MSNQLEEQLLAAIDTTKNALRVTGGGGSSELVTSADDTTTTLTTASESQVVVTGSGVLPEIDLGDATTYSNGKTYRIHNGGTEFLGVVNSDNTVWERVPPWCSLTAVLLDNSTAAGVWFVNTSMETQIGRCSVIRDDFYGSGGNVYGAFTMVRTVNGTGATVVYGTGSTETYNGLLFFGSGTTATGYASILAGPCRFGTPATPTGCVGIESSVKLTAAPTASEDFIWTFGFNDSATNAAATDGAWLEVDDATASGNWRLVTSAAGSTTAVASAVAATSDPARLRVEVASDGSRVDAWVDANYIGKSTTNVPTGTQLADPCIKVVKTVGTGSRGANVDYLSLEYGLITKR
jgi:hypothetical protein